MKDRIAQELSEKARRYVESPEDAPEDVEVNEGPQGGLWYESEGTDSEDSDNQRDVIQSETSTKLQDIVSDDSMDDATKKAMMIKPFQDATGIKPFMGQEISASKWADMLSYISNVQESLGDDSLQRVSSIKVGRADDTDEDMVGSYNPESGEIYISPESFDEEMGDDFKSTNHEYHNIIHEVGHALHFSQVFGDLDTTSASAVQSFSTNLKSWDSEEDKEKVKNNVSAYGSYMPIEFVAEAFVSLSMGEELDDELYELYNSLKGPSIPLAKIPGEQ